MMLGACGADDGAILTFEAPGGPMSAARIQIVLASADLETIGTGIRQRMAPGALREEDVVYYRQRARGGIVEAVDAVDGLLVRIEPEVDIAADEKFIPFALIFDEASELVAVGAVEDPDGNPMPVEIREDVRVEYTMMITPVANPGDDVALEPNHGFAVGCLDQDAEEWTSGVAWRPDTGPQLRLLLADLGADPDATDATERSADLDCDAFDAADDDCDDLRSAYHPGQAETCDGLDTDCDGRRAEIQPCVLPTGACGGTGVSLCTDEGANVGATQCQPDPTCACLDSQDASCARCIIDTREAGAARAACAPAIGKLHLDPYCDGGCTAEVVAVDGPFEVTLAGDERGPFAGRTQSPGHVYVRAKTSHSFPTPAMTYTSVGRVFLAVTNAIHTQAVNFDLEIIDEAIEDCRSSLLVDHYSMFCTP